MKAELRKVASIVGEYESLPCRVDYWVTGIGPTVKKPDGTVSAEVSLHIERIHVQNVN